MARPLIAALVIALVIAVIFGIGEFVGERRERRHTATDLTVLRAQLHQQHAALMGIPVEAVEHGRLVAAEHLGRWQPALDRLAAHLHLRRAA